MFKHALWAVFAVGLATAPVVAQTTSPSTAPMPTAAKSSADCEANFKTADKNGDGKLDQTEITANKSMMPTTLASHASATKQEFLSACTSSAPAKK